MLTSRALASTTAMLALSAGLLAPASAQTPLTLQPGLWEHSISLKSQSGQMEAALAQARKAMASMPAAQRQQLEQMMAARGVGIGSGGPQGQSVQVCVTPEQAAMDRLPHQDGCTQAVQRVDARTLHVRFSCKGGQGQPPTRGEGTVHFQSATAYTGQFQIQTTGATGKPEQIDMAQTGQWRASDCGAIQPAPLGR